MGVLGILFPAEASGRLAMITALAIILIKVHASSGVLAFALKAQAMQAPRPQSLATTGTAAS